MYCDDRSWHGQRQLIDDPGVSSGTKNQSSRYRIVYTKLTTSSWQVITRLKNSESGDHYSDYSSLRQHFCSRARAGFECFSKSVKFSVLRSAFNLHCTDGMSRAAVLFAINIRGNQRLTVRGKAASRLLGKCMERARQYFSLSLFASLQSPPSPVCLHATSGMKKKVVHCSAAAFCREQNNCSSKIPSGLLRVSAYYFSHC